MNRERKSDAFARAHELMSNEAKPDALAEIDQLIGPVEVKPVAKQVISFQEVKDVTRFIDANSHDEEAQKTLSGLKDAARKLVIKREGRYFPGSGALWDEFNLLRDRWLANKDDVYLISYDRDFRSRALAHVLSADPSTIPKAVRENVADIRQKYAGVEQKYHDWKTPPGV